MPEASSQKTVTTTHPETGSTKKIDERLYKVFSEAIISTLKNSQGLSFTDLSKNVTTLVKKNYPSFKGSHSWYTITIRLDLEHRGKVETYTSGGKKFSRLKK